jgi:hypothetical protein
MIADFPPTFAKMGPALVRTGHDWDSRGDPTTAVYVIWKHEHGKITILRTITFRR